jgi:hypothetical protein
LRGVTRLRGIRYAAYSTHKSCLLYSDTNTHSVIGTRPKNLSEFVQIIDFPGACTECACSGGL